MRRFCHCLEVCPVLAIIVISTASAVSPADWQLASSDENIFDFNAPDGQDWTLSTSDSFQGGGDTVSFNSGIIYQPPSDDISSLSNLDDNQQLFMNDNDDPQTEDFLLAGAVPNAKGEECSASDLAGKIRRRGHPLCSTGTTGFLHALPAGTVRDAGSFDLLYCPVASILIKSLFVCSSPDPLKTILVFPLYTLLESTRVSDDEDAENCQFPSALYCCGDWLISSAPPPYPVGRMSVGEILSRPPLVIVGTGLECTPFGPWTPRPHGVIGDQGGDGDGDRK